MAASAERVDYQRLKTWIAAQEAFESATKQPAPLTPAQRQAITDLTRVIQSTPRPTVQDVDLGNKNYISLLQEWHVTKQNTGITMTYSDPVPVPGPPPQPSPSWTQTLTLASARFGYHPKLVFPSASTGGLIHGAVPHFPNKKNAKKYAAKICFEWLASNGWQLDSIFLSTSSTPALSTPLNPTPVPSPIPLAPSPIPNDGGGAPLANPSLKRKSTASLSQGSEAEADDDDARSEESGIPAPQRVTELCRKLQIQAPTYKTMPSVLIEGWNGEPDFGRDAYLFEEEERKGLRVAGARSKKAAREMVAEKVLVYLRREEERRERSKRGILGDD